MTLKTYDSGYRGDCPKEELDQSAFVDYLRKLYPKTYGAVVVHVANEGRRSYAQSNRAKKLGLTVGASDILIPGVVSFVCELKRKDRTKSRVSESQMDYLIAAHKLGSFACLCYGYDAAVEAFNDYKMENMHEL